jgi:hypothetical protein
MDQVIKEVIEQIKKDFNDGDTQALEEMLSELPLEVLEAYLPE